MIGMLGPICKLTTNSGREACGLSFRRARRLQSDYSKPPAQGEALKYASAPDDLTDGQIPRLWRAAAQTAAQASMSPASRLVRPQTQAAAALGAGPIAAPRQRRQEGVRLEQAAGSPSAASRSTRAHQQYGLFRLRRSAHQPRNRPQDPWA